MESNFFALMSRMKYIERWSLMRNSSKENVSEHSMEVAMISHLLAIISNVRLGNSWNVERAAIIGLYHDATEILTGDLPTPIKYANEMIQDAYKEIEAQATKQLLDQLPIDIREVYETIFYQQEDESYLWKLKKAADKISGLIKCVEEEKAGNKEFLHARKTIEQSLLSMQLPEVSIFLAEFLPAYNKTLDELKL